MEGAQTHLETLNTGIVSRKLQLPRLSLVFSTDVHDTEGEIFLGQDGHMNMKNSFSHFYGTFSF